MTSAARATPDDPMPQEDVSWRDRAMRLQAAGLVDRVLVLGPCEEREEAGLLAPVLDLVAGPVFRLAPGRYAALICDDASVEAALPPGGRLEGIDPPPQDDAAPDPGMNYLAPLKAAAWRAGGPRLVIDADFAIETATRAAEGIARIVSEADRKRGRAQAARSSADIASRKRIAQRLEGIEASVDALRHAKAVDGFVSRIDGLDAALVDLRAALAAERQEGRERATHQAARLEAALEAAAAPDPQALVGMIVAALSARSDAQDAALADLTALARVRPSRPDISQERDGVARLSLALQSMLRRLDERIDRLSEVVDTARISAPSAATLDGSAFEALEALEARLIARIDAAAESAACAEARRAGASESFADGLLRLARTADALDVQGAEARSRGDAFLATLGVALAEFLAVQTRSAETGRT